MKEPHSGQKGVGSECSTAVTGIIVQQGFCKFLKKSVLMLKIWKVYFYDKKSLRRSLEYTQNREFYADLNNVEWLLK